MTALASCVAVVGMTMAPADAQSGRLPIEVSATRVPAGGVIEVSGSGCTGPVTVELWSIDTVSVVDEATVDGDDTGDWSAEVTLPATAQVNSLYHVKVACQVDGSPEYSGAHITAISKWPEGVFTIEVDPVRGPIGTTIHVQGSRCDSERDSDIEYALLAGTSLEDTTALVDAGSTHVVADPIIDGWRGELVVYDTMLDLFADPQDGLTELDVVPGDDYFVIAACTPWDAVDPILSDPVDFDVTADATAPRPDDGPPQDTAIIPIVPQAQAAAPVVAQPTYTG